MPPSILKVSWWLYVQSSAFGSMAKCMILLGGALQCRQDGDTVELVGQPYEARLQSYDRGGPPQSLLNILDYNIIDQPI